MTVTEGLPYEECGRWGERSPRDGTVSWPAYALPPFRPAPRPPVSRPPAPRPPVSRPPVARPYVHRSGRRVRRVVDGAAVSGVLTALCAAALLVTVVLATVRTRG
ncbi:hypothetical protein AB0F03_07350 [Streptomyces sp. NPDC028722]|uniref:hypothetical protein n=1 Tax=unclassified Streptomyces TaxID=2593676 RepID=UPI0033DD13F0